MKVSELLDSEEKWCKGSMAKTKDGERVGTADSRATCFCLLGAVYRCYDTDDVRDIIADKIFVSIGDQTVSRWNDAPERTFADVRQLITELDI